MPVTINGSGTITGLSVGGLPDGIVDTDMLANNAVATGKIADNAVTSAKSSGLGISMIDSWRITADTGNAPTTLTSNWERTDTVVPAFKGTGLTESSGVCTFPQTGLYLILCNFRVDLGDDDATANVDIRVSTNSTTTYDDTNFVRATMTTQGNKGSSGVSQGLYGSYVLDVTSISTTRFAFRANSFAGNSQILGDTDHNQSYFQIIRLGDT